MSLRVALLQAPHVPQAMLPCTSSPSARLVQSRSVSTRALTAPPRCSLRAADRVTGSMAARQIPLAVAEAADGPIRSKALPLAGAHAAPPCPDRMSAFAPSLPFSASSLRSCPADAARSCRLRAATKIKAWPPYSAIGPLTSTSSGHSVAEAACRPWRGLLRPTTLAASASRPGAAVLM
jgi:hypothetical protein